MKKILIFMLAAMMLLTACSNGGETSSIASEMPSVSEVTSEIVSGVTSDLPSDNMQSSSSSSASSSSSSAPSKPAEPELKPTTGKDKDFALKNGVYTKITGTTALFVIPKDLSAEKDQEKAEKDLVQKTIDQYYKQGYYCIASIVKPDSKDTFDINKVRNDFKFQIYKKQTDMNPSTNSGTAFGGTSITNEKTLKNQSLGDYLNQQVEKLSD